MCRNDRVDLVYRKRKLFFIKNRVKLHKVPIGLVKTAFIELSEEIKMQICLNAAESFAQREVIQQIALEIVKKAAVFDRKKRRLRESFQFSALGIGKLLIGKCDMQDEQTEDQQEEKPDRGVFFEFFHGFASLETEIEEGIKAPIDEVSGADDEQSRRYNGCQHSGNFCADCIFFELLGKIPHKRRCADAAEDDQNRIAPQIIERFAADKRQFAKAEKPADIGQNFGHRSGVKNNEAQHDDEKQVDMPQECRQFFDPFEEEELFQSQQNAEIDAPEDEVKSSTVPEPCRCPDDKNI